MNLSNPSEQALDIISVDLYNKKVVIRGEEGSTITFKCATINELVELKEQCGKVLKSNNFVVR
jgi:hypothetical protein